MSTSDVRPGGPAHAGRPDLGVRTTRQLMAVTTPGRLRGPGYEHLARSVWRPVVADRSARGPGTPTGSDPHALSVATARALVGDVPVLVGASAAWVWGLDAVGPDEPAHLALDRPHVFRHHGVRVRGHQSDLAADEVVASPYGPVTSWRRTAVDLARAFGTRRAGLGTRVAWLDGLVRVTGLTAADVVDAVHEKHRLHGIVRARQAALLVRDGVDSARETGLRLLVTGHGLPEPRVQCPVRTLPGTVVARLDLGWEEHRVGAEYDGAVHLDPAQHSRDLARHNRIRAAGWTVVQVDAGSFARPREVLHLLEGLLATP